MHRLGLWGVSLSVMWAASPGQWHVDSPKNGALIRSSFVVISGAAPRDECAQVLLAGVEAARVCASQAGTFERIVHLPSGRASIELRPDNQRTERPSAIELTIEPPPASFASGARTAEVHWEWMRSGDVVLSHSLGSEQADLYNAVFTHAAVYFGPASDGAALMAEAVTAADAEGLGEVRTVPIEQSMAFRHGTTVAILRPAAPLSLGERQALLEFLGSVVNRGLRYWSAAEDFSNLYSAWILWDPRADRPRDPVRFARVLDTLESRKFATDRFTCAGLVWRAYWTATQGRVDLAAPNHAEIGGRLAGALTRGFLARVQPWYILPDSLYRSGKLVEVRE
jgi:hypothetical protein